MYITLKIILAQHDEIHKQISDFVEDQTVLAKVKAWYIPNIYTTSHTNFEGASTILFGEHHLRVLYIPQLEKNAPLLR